MGTISLTPLKIILSCSDNSSRKLKQTLVLRSTSFLWLGHSFLFCADLEIFNHPDIPYRSNELFFFFTCLYTFQRVACAQLLSCTSSVAHHSQDDLL